jgi:hypothetical protein
MEQELISMYGPRTAPYYPNYYMTDIDNVIIIKSTLRELYNGIYYDILLQRCFKYDKVEIELTVNFKIHVKTDLIILFAKDVYLRQHLAVLDPSYKPSDNQESEADRLKKLV